MRWFGKNKAPDKPDTIGGGAPAAATTATPATAADPATTTAPAATTAETAAGATPATTTATTAAAANPADASADSSAPGDAAAAAADPATTSAAATAPAAAASGDAATAPASAAPASGDAPAAAAPSAPAGAASNSSSPPPASPPSPPPPTSPLSASRSLAVAQAAGATPPPTDALNKQIVQAVTFTNAETASYAPSQIATGPDMMISQAAGLVAQSAAAYFDGVTKIALASQGVLMKQMTQDLVEGNVEQAAEDALGILATDIFMGAAAAVAAAAGAMEAASAGFAIDRIDQSIEKYSTLLQNRKSS